MQDLLIPLFLVVLFAAADRWAGGGLGWTLVRRTEAGGWLRGRPAYYSVPLVLLAGFLLGAGIGLAAALVWAVYRSALPFPDGTLDGRNLPMTALRHTTLVAVLAWVIIAMGHEPADSVPFLIYAFVATLLAVHNGRQYDLGRDTNWRVELYRGATFGAAFWAFLSAVGRI